MYETLPELTLKSLTDNAGTATVVIGPRGCGKTTFLNEVIHNLQQPQPQPQEKGLYDYVSSLFNGLFSGISTPYNVLDFDAGKIRTHSNMSARSIIMGDDVAVMGNEVLVAFRTGKNMNFSCITTRQTATRMSADERANVSFVILMNTKYLHERSKIWRYWFEGYITKDDFDDLFEKYTKDNGCLVLDVLALSRSEKNCLFHFKANSALPNYMPSNRLLWLEERL